MGMDSHAISPISSRTASRLRLSRPINPGWPAGCPHYVKPSHRAEITIIFSSIQLPLTP